MKTAVAVVHPQHDSMRGRWVGSVDRHRKVVCITTPTITTKEIVYLVEAAIIVKHSGLSAGGTESVFKKGT